MPYMEDGTSVDIVLNPRSAIQDEHWPGSGDTLRTCGFGLVAKSRMLEKQQPVKLREFINQIYESKVAQDTWER